MARFEYDKIDRDIREAIQEGMRDYQFERNLGRLEFECGKSCCCEVSDLKKLLEFGRA